MTIYRSGASVIAQCDDCIEYAEQDDGDFNSLRQQLNEAGWKTVKDGEEWKHYCPDCCSARLSDDE